MKQSVSPYELIDYLRSHSRNKGIEWVLQIKYLQHYLQRYLQRHKAH